MLNNSETSFRMGLIGARLIGARYATARVLVFLDALSEPNDGWLEPLLSRIDKSRISALTPVEDVINSNNFAYIPTTINSDMVDVFRFDGTYTVTKVTKREKKRQLRNCAYENKVICPIRIPIITSSMMAIERDFFWEIGSYDEQVRTKSNHFTIKCNYLN